MAVLEPLAWGVEVWLSLGSTKGPLRLRGWSSFLSGRRGSGYRPPVRVPSKEDIGKVEGHLNALAWPVIPLAPGTWRSVIERLSLNRVSDKCLCFRDETWL